MTGLQVLGPRIQLDERGDVEGDGHGLGDRAGNLDLMLILWLGDEQVRLRTKMGGREGRANEDGWRSSRCWCKSERMSWSSSSSGSIPR